MAAGFAASAEGARGAIVTSAAVIPRAPSSNAAFGTMAQAPSRAERRFDKRERALAGDVVNRPHAQHRVQLLGRHLHRPGSRSGARSRLWERRRPRSVERHVALDLLLDLVNVAVEHRYRAEPLQIAERARGVLGAPTPFLVDRP